LIGDFDLLLSPSGEQAGGTSCLGEGQRSSSEKVLYKFVRRQEWILLSAKNSGHQKAAREFAKASFF